MVLPNFFVIGAAKAGTTSIDRYLRQHPEIFMCPINEPKFFSFENECLNFNYPNNVKWKDGKVPINNNVITDLDVYENLYVDVSDEKAIGEVSPVYLYLSEKTAKAISCHVPDAKIIAVLRNPVQRAYANFTHLMRDGLEPLRNFKDALDAEEERIKENWWPFWHYKGHGFYYEQLKSYYNYFDSKNIKVLLHDDYCSNSLCFFADIFRFLEVDDRFKVDTSSRYNVSGIPRSKTLYKVLESRNLLTNSLRKIFTAEMRQRLRQFLLSKPKISKEVKEDLLDLYRRDILSLQDLIGRDLSTWLDS